MDNHEFDYSKITDNIYIGSDLCKGNVCPIHGPQFNELGILVEINLTAEKKEVPPDGIDIYAWIPIGDMFSPSQDQFDLGTAVINEAILKNKKVYVHCKEGHGRSPTMVIAYLIRYQGKNLEEAIQLVKEKRVETHIEDVQMEGLRAFFERWEKTNA